MSSEHTYQLLADVVLSVHVLLVMFVIGGLVLVVVGNLRKWQWVNMLGFRLVHLGTLAIVVAESWLRVTCPLTDLEMWLRERAHDTPYADSFIEHWLQKLLYYQAPAWTFAIVYTVFGALVVASWVWFPPVGWRRAPRSDV